MNMTKEDILHHNPKSGMIDLAKQKQAESDEIKRLTEEYLAQGGKIKMLKNGEIADYNSIRKEPYNNSLKPYNDKGMKTL